MMLVLLQNAWSPYWANRVWPRRGWLDALWACQTGLKLDKYILKDIPESDYWVDNTTPVCGKLSSSVMKPDLDYIRNVLRGHKIASVMACGKQPGEVIDQVWRGPCVKIPHPACRWMSRKIMRFCNSQIIYMEQAASGGKITRQTVFTDATGGIWATGPAEVVADGPWGSYIINEGEAA